MKILVCISNVPDTTTKIRLSAESRSIDSNGFQWIINPWDELALSRAIDLKEASAGLITEVAVINVGTSATEPTIRKALAMGADKGIRINAEASDAYFVANQIAEVLKKENYDIVLSGIESSDHNGSSVGAMIAEFVEMPSVSSVSSIIIEGGNIFLNREIDGGTESITVPTPFLAVVQKGIAIEPKIPSMRGIMMARTKQLSVMEAVQSSMLTEYVGYDLPGAKSKCKMISEDSVSELVDLLKNEAKVI